MQVMSTNWLPKFRRAHKAKIKINASTDNNNDNSNSNNNNNGSIAQTDDEDIELQTFTTHSADGEHQNEAQPGDNNNNDNNGNHADSNNNPRTPLNTAAAPNRKYWKDLKWQRRYFVSQRGRIQWFWAPAFVALWVLLYLWVIIPVYSRLPTPLTSEQAGDCKGGCFVAERAEWQLDELAALGPRVLDSAQAIGNMTAFFRQAHALMRRVLKPTVHRLEMDVQRSAGNFVQWDTVYAYSGLQNVAFRLSAAGSDRVEANQAYGALLVNAHYDTVPHSPGAGDNGIAIAVMLEALYVLCQSTTSLKHPVVFLFNGGGELAQQGAHAFITQHRWARQVRAVINLDSAGSGGREILFQSGPNNPWLAKSYRRAVKHPFANTLAEELFQRDVIPSITDLDIFYAYGKVPGLDFTYHYNGYVYHTSRDLPQFIQSGTFQHSGDNLLSLVRELSSAPQLDSTRAATADGHMVYYDLLGIWLITYSETEGIILNLIVSVALVVTCCFSFYVMAQQIRIGDRSVQQRGTQPLARVLQNFGQLFVVQIFAVLIAFACYMLTAVGVDYVGVSLAWFSQPWLIIGLYYCPTFFGYSITVALYFMWADGSRLPASFRVQLLLHCHCILLACFTIMLTASGIRSTFIMSLALLCYTAGLIVNLATRLHNKPTAWIVVHTISCVPPFLFYAYLTHGFFIAIIPMTGWLDGSSNPEFYVGVFTLLMCILTGGFMFPILVMFDKTKTIITLPLVLTLACFIIAFTPLGFPFRAETNVQRISIVHTNRTFYAANGSVRHTDAGYVILPLDHRSDTFKEHVINASSVRSVQSVGAGEMFFGLPLYNHRWHEFKASALWIAAAPLSAELLQQRPSLALISKATPPLEILTRFELQLSGGPAQLSLYIKPLHGARLMAWSFASASLRAHWRPPYVINYYSGNNTVESLNFWLEFMMPPQDLSMETHADLQHSDAELPTFEIALSAYWTQQAATKYWTNEFKEFIDSFPDYVDASAWPASYETWQF